MDRTRVLRRLTRAVKVDGRAGLVILLGLHTSTMAQTTVDLSRQGKNVDFSSAISTKPSKTGAILPPICSVAETFFNTNAPPGQNLYGCTALNTWTLLQGSNNNTLALKLDAGSVLTPRSTLHVLTGTGITPTITDTGSEITLQNDINTAQVVTSYEIHLGMGQCTGAAASTLRWNIPPSGTAATAGGCSGTNTNDAYAVFANSGTPSLQFSLTLPRTLTGLADVYINYLTATASGAWTPALDVVCTNTAGSAANDPAYTANNFFAPGQTTAPSTANLLTTVSASSLAWPTGCTGGNRAHFRLIRTDTGTAVNVNVAEVIVIARRTL